MRRSRSKRRACEGVFDVNAFGVFRVTKAFSPLLHENRGLVSDDVAKTVFRILHARKPKGRYTVSPTPVAAYQSPRLPDTPVDSVFRKS